MPGFPHTVQVHSAKNDWDCTAGLPQKGQYPFKRDFPNDKGHVEPAMEGLYCDQQDEDGLQ